MIEEFTHMPLVDRDDDYPNTDPIPREAAYEAPERRMHCTCLRQELRNRNWTVVDQQDQHSFSPARDSGSPFPSRYELWPEPAEPSP